MRDPRLEGMVTRYCSFSRYVNFLESGLFLSNAQNFEDPWEGHVFHQVTADPANHENLAAFVLDRKRFLYVSCWHASDHESYAMWRIYGKEDAVAIHTDGDKLKGLLSDIHRQHQAKPLLLTPVEYCMPTQGKLPKVDKNRIYSVSYEDDLSEQDALWRNAMQQFLMYKPSAYQYEQEVRIIALDSEAPELMKLHPDFEEKKGLAVSLNPSEFITGITVAPWANSAFVESVKAVSEKYGLPADLVKKSDLFSNPGQKNG